jgi:hypothetical protein
LEKAEKKARSREFIKTKVTWATFTELMLFNRNAANLLNVIRLEKTLLDKLEKNEIDHGLSNESLLETKHLLLTDILAKIMMLIEGLMVLIESISNPKKGYPKLAEEMACYRPGSIWRVIESLRAGELDGATIAGLPRLDKLLINDLERRALEPFFRESSRTFIKLLTVIANFYECNNIVYNKFKHGLSLIAGMTLKNPQQQSVASVIVALDRRETAPPCTSREMPERLMPPEVEWFNTMCYVPFGKLALDKYGEIASILFELISYLTNNHMFLAANCDEDYFPIRIMPNGNYVPSLLLEHDLSPEEKNLLEPIVRKITENMNIPEFRFNLNLNFSDEAIKRVLESFQDHASALIWSSGRSESSAAVIVT